MSLLELEWKALASRDYYNARSEAYLKVIKEVTRLIEDEVRISRQAKTHIDNPPPHTDIPMWQGVRTRALRRQLHLEALREELSMEIA